MPRWLDQGRLRSAELDRQAALALHRAVRRPAWVRCFALASRLGDAPMWLALIVLLPVLDAAAGSRAARVVALLGGVNLLIYWLLKRSTRRQRPYQCCDGIKPCAKVPDAFSFPSGHTLHAVAFALVLSAFYPALSLPLWVFAALVGVSRVVLGLHYPSDVIVGALIGAATASWLLPVP